MNLNYALALGFSAAISGLLTLVVINKRSSAGAPGLALTMVAMFIWSSTYAIHWSVTTPQIRNFWLDMTYFGALLAPTALLIFALQYTNRADVLTRRNIAILSVEPLFILVLLWTDPLFNLFYAGLRTVDSIHQGGLGFWFNLIYSYAVIGTAILYLIRYMNKKGKTVRNGVLLVIAAMLLPSIGPIIGILKFPFLIDLDTTPFLFLASSILIYFSMVHFRLLDLAPTAHSKLIETLQDAMIVLDENRSILEINPAASLLFGSRAIQPGREMQEVFDDQPVLLDAIKTGQNHSLIIQLDNGNPHIYEVTISTLNNRFQHLNGWLILFHDITVYKQTEAALTQSENRLNSLFSSMTDVILILDKDGRYLEIAPTNPNNLARDPFNLIGKTVFDVFPEEDANLFLETIANALETRQMVRVDYSMIIEGRQVWFAGNVSPLDENSVTWVARDITERKKAEEEIRESENKLRALFSAMTDVIFVLDSSGRYIEIAPTSTEGLYLTPEQILGKTVTELLPEETSYEIVQAVQTALSTKSSVNLEYSLPINGESRWFSARVSPLTNDKVILVAHDISDLQNSLNALSAQEELYTDLLNNLNEGICIVDLEEYFTFTNPTANMIFGVFEESLVGRNIEEFVNVESYDFLKDQTKERKAGKSGRYELRIRRPDGEYRYLQVSPRPQMDKTGTIIGTFAVFHDITESRMAQQAIVESETRLSLAQELAHVGNYEWDVATRTMWASPETFNIFGLNQTSSIISFRDVLKRIIKEDQARFAEIMRDMLLDKPVFVEEFRIRRDGETELRILQGIAKKLLDADGNVIKLSGVVQDITDLKQTELALEKRVLALTLPLEGGENITFDDLFNLSEIQKLQDEFSEATGVASIITSTENTYITNPSNFCFLCKDIIQNTEIGRAKCLQSNVILGEYNPSGARMQLCMSGGLWEAGAAITVGGKHIANWLIGQVRDETQTEEKIRAYARQIGANEDDAARAFLKVPVMTKERFEQISKTLYTLANQLSTMAYQNIQQARFISDRQQAENALQQSENKLRKIFSSMSDIIIIYDKDGRYVEIAPTNTGKLYRPPEELLNYTISEIFDPETASLFMRSIHTTLEKGSPQQVDYKLNIRGEDFWFTSSVSPLSDSQVIWVARDITDRKMAEEEINKFKLWVERSNDVIFMTDIQGSITFANEAFERVYGYTLDETLGQTPRIIKSGLISQEEYKGFWQTLLNKGVITGEMINKTKDGRMIPVEGSNNPILNSEGEIIGFISVHHDISERKKAEEAMALQSTALNAAANAIVITDNMGKIEWVNPAFTDLSGYTSENAVGKNPRQLLKSGMHNPTFYKNMWDTILRGDIWRGELINRKKSGAHYYEEMTITPLRNSEGNISKFVAIKLDISERKQAEQTLQYQSTHDILTGLFNRQYYEAEVLRLQQSRRFPISILVLDVDKLKYTNDTYGHAAGDELLRRVAGVLKSTFRPEDMVARMGGDEFVVVLPETTAAAATQAIHRLQEILKVHNSLFSREQHLGFSIGSATGETNTQLTEVFKEADSAMFINKAAKKELTDH